jgi:hypothetical protein
MQANISNISPINSLIQLQPRTTIDGDILKKIQKHHRESTQNSLPEGNSAQRKGKERAAKIGEITEKA